jgi:hypothetical protein
MLNVTKRETVGWSLFGTEKANYICLTVLDVSIWDSEPKNSLAIPKNWNDFWDGDFKITPSHFLPRAAALRHCAFENQKAINDSPDGDGVPDNWTLVFRLGVWEDTSCLFVDLGKTTLSIDTRLMVVRPTSAEVKDQLDWVKAAG